MASNMELDIILIPMERQNKVNGSKENGLNGLNDENI